MLTQFVMTIAAVILSFAKTKRIIGFCIFANERCRRAEIPMRGTAFYAELGISQVIWHENKGAAAIVHVMRDQCDTTMPPNDMQPTNLGEY